MSLQNFVWNTLNSCSMKIFPSEGFCRDMLHGLYLFRFLCWAFLACCIMVFFPYITLVLYTLLEGWHILIMPLIHFYLTVCFDVCLCVWYNKEIHLFTLPTREKGKFSWHTNKVLPSEVLILLRKVQCQGMK